MDNNKELDQINRELTEEWKALSVGGYENQIMWNSFVQDKLAQFELRLRKIELNLRCRTDNTIGGY